MDQASASAPASIGNVGVGFDILGQAFDAARDRVTAWREDAPGIRLGIVSGLVKSLPEKAEANTALAVEYCKAHPRWRLSLQTHKLIGLR